MSTKSLQQVYQNYLQQIRYAKTGKILKIFRLLILKMRKNNIFNSEKNVQNDVSIEGLLRYCFTK